MTSCREPRRPPSVTTWRQERTLESRSLRGRMQQPAHLICSELPPLSLERQSDEERVHAVFFETMSMVVTVLSGWGLVQASENSRISRPFSAE